MVCMAVRSLRVLAIAMMCSSALSCAHAEVVTVSPASPGDWSWMLNTTLLVSGSPGYTEAYFNPGGPAPAEGNPFPTGNGAFYATLSWAYDYNTPDSVWLGVDRHNSQPLAGIPLRKLTKLEYVAYSGGIWNAKFEGNEHPRRYPYQPFMLTLTVKDAQGNRRQLWYRPWGIIGWPHWNNRRDWLTLDAIAMSSTPDHGGGAAAPVWYEAVTDKVYPDWETVLNGNGADLAGLGDFTLVPTSTGWKNSGRGDYDWKSPGWDSSTSPVGAAAATGTGKCVNFWVGARKSSHPRLAWGGALESVGFMGYVDSFTLGVDYGDEQTSNVVETTYDFASDDPAPARVAVCNTGWSRWFSGPASQVYEYPYCSYNPSMPNIWARAVPKGPADNQDKFLYRFFGRVMDFTGWESQLGEQYGPGKDPDTGEFYFTIWDGTPCVVSDGLGRDWEFRRMASVNVRLPWWESTSIDGLDPETWPVHIGDYVSVMGYLYDSAYLWRLLPPAEISADRGNIKVYTAE